MHIFILP